MSGQSPRYEARKFPTERMRGFKFGVFDNTTQQFVPCIECRYTEVAEERARVYNEAYKRAME